VVLQVLQAAHWPQPPATAADTTLSSADHLANGMILTFDKKDFLVGFLKIFFWFTKLNYYFFLDC
jgi:hypothetical protein